MSKAKKLSAHERSLLWVGKFLRRHIQEDANTQLISTKIFRDLNKPKE